MKESKLRSIIREEILKESRHHNEMLADQLSARGLDATVKYNDKVIFTDRDGTRWEVSQLTQLDPDRDTFGARIRQREGKAIKGRGIQGIIDEILNQTS